MYNFWSRMEQEVRENAQVNQYTPGNGDELFVKKEQLVGAE
jgi:hypothetical protein